jgi:enhancing lycopene biosynthesis protein 2
MKIAVLLSGCGVYDGSEIHEAVLTLLALNRLGAETICIAPDIEQHHVINHLNGSETGEKRNILTESARIARGNIQKLSAVSVNDFDGLAIPGGFGVAKTFTKWAFSGNEGEILPEIKDLLLACFKNNKPIASLCISPVVLAKAVEGSGIKLKLSVGNLESPSPYDINGISAGISKTGSIPNMCGNTDLLFDDLNNVVTSPCYMMEASIAEVFEGIEKTMSKLVEMVMLLKES